MTSLGRTRMATLVLCVLGILVALVFAGVTVLLGAALGFGVGAALGRELPPRRGPHA